MKTLEYTPQILTLISAGKKLEAIKMAKDLYGLSLQEAKNMIDSYRPGGLNFYTTFELNTKSDYTPEIAKLINEGKISEAVREAKNTYGISEENAQKMIENYPQSETSTKPVKSTKPIRQERQQQAKNNEDILPYCCPNCGSNQVEKSIGGKLEHAAAWAATKAAKAYVMGDYGSFTGGVENDIIKEELPFQQVCNYCHQTFHARKSQIEAGRYAMSKSKSSQLMNAYNRKLKVVKDEEVNTIKEEASKKLSRIGISGASLLIGLLIIATCEHSTIGVFGLQSYTWSFMFSCVLIFFGFLGVVVEGNAYYGKISEANEIDDMSIEEYARDHKA
jgi:hypothetical protein